MTIDNDDVVEAATAEEFAFWLVGTPSAAGQNSLFKQTAIFIAT